MQEFLVIPARTEVVLVTVFLIVRFSGKRSSAQLNLYDLVTLIAVANAVQNALTAGKGTLVIGFASAFTLIFMSYILGRVFVKDPQLEKQLIGTPTVIIQNGHIRYAAMRSECLSREEIDTAIRGFGLESIADVRLAVMEVDGNLSIVPKESAKKSS